MGDYDARGTYLGPELHNAPEIRFDAVRAVTHEHQSRPETPETLTDARLVLDMLGLLEQSARPVSVSPSSVPCPQCLTGIGQPCIAAKTGQPWNGYHRSRQRQAQELREAAA